MFNKEDTIQKKMGMMTGLIIALTGLIAAWTAVVKVYNPPPPEEKKAKQAYEIMKEKFEFHEDVLRDTREMLRDQAREHDKDMNDLKMMLLLGRIAPDVAEEPSVRRRGASRSPASIMPESDVEGILALEDLDLDSVPEPEPEPAPANIRVEQQRVDPLMSKAKPLPKKL